MGTTASDIVTSGDVQAATATISGAATVGGTLGVTGLATLTVPLQLPVYTVAAAPTATIGQLAYFSNGAAGSPCIAFGNGTNWIRADDSATAIAIA